MDETKTWNETGESLSDDDASVRSEKFRQLTALIEGNPDMEPEWDESISDSEMLQAILEERYLE